jgi:hypothetical protein
MLDSEVMSFHLRPLHFEVNKKGNSFGHQIRVVAQPLSLV